MQDEPQPDVVDFPGIDQLRAKEERRKVKKIYAVGAIP